jgi:hypothetical protein
MKRPNLSGLPAAHQIAKRIARIARYCLAMLGGNRLTWH